jgi:AcrR family transcriptional regulator
LYGLSSEVVAEDQSRRILAAASIVFARFGYNATSVLSIIESAGVSRRTFYDLFAGKADAFGAAHEEAFAVFAERVRLACEYEREWPVKVARAVEAAVEWAAANPSRARLIVAEPFTVGTQRACCYDLLVSRFTPSLRPGRVACKTELSPSLEEALLVSASALVASRLEPKRIGSLSALTPHIAEFLLTPYLGAEKARRQARG